MIARPALVLVVAFVLGVGCRSNPSTIKAPIKPLLWSVTKDGKTSHLMGTMHAGIDHHRVPAYVWDIVAAARVTAFEADLSQAAQLPVVRTDGSSLRDELGPAYWKKLEDVIGVGEAARLVSLKPMIAASIVSMQGLPATLPLDGAIENRARDRPIVYLEPLASQFAMLERWLDARALKDMLDHIDEVKDTSRRMLAAFVAGDETAVLAVTERERKLWVAHGRTEAEWDDQMNDLLYRRNASWLPALEKLHADGGAFIAVGAAHLCGPKSLVDLLRERGYTVTRVTR